MKKSSLVDCTPKGELTKAIRYARKIGDQSLIQCLKSLNRVHGEGYAYENGHTNIYNDSAPFSFYFERFGGAKNFRGNGGIIFHGKHDGFGSGSAPTFSVCLNPTNGWSIHT
jgi:hypothetical protein